MTFDPRSLASAAAMVRAVAAHRITHFALLGGALFALAPHARSSDVIEVSASELDALHRAQARRLGQDVLTPEQTREVDARALEDEVLYREAIRMGLDKSDGIVRQRLVQKSLFLAEDLGSAAVAPTNDELRAFFERTRARWTHPGTVHFVHVFAATRNDARLAQLRDEAAVTAGDAPPAIGDAFPLSRDVKLNPNQIRTQYGAELAQAVATAAIGDWTGPVPSKFGWHVVRVVGREDARAATFDEALPELGLAYAIDRRERATAAFIANACKRYEVRAAGAEIACASSGRLAVGNREGWD